jgi:hypothetical protein
VPTKRTLQLLDPEAGILQGGSLCWRPRGVFRECSAHPVWRCRAIDAGSDIVSHRHFSCLLPPSQCHTPHSGITWRIRRAFDFSRLVFTPAGTSVPRARPATQSQPTLPESAHPWLVQANPMVGQDCCAGLAGHYRWMTIMRDDHAGRSCGTIMRDDHAGRSCDTLCQRVARRDAAGAGAGQR